MDVDFTFAERDLAPFEFIHLDLREESSRFPTRAQLLGDESTFDGQVNSNWTHDGQVDDWVYERMEDEEALGPAEQLEATETFFEGNSLWHIVDFIVLFGEGCPRALDHVGLDAECYEASSYGHLKEEE